MGRYGLEAELPPSVGLDGSWLAAARRGARRLSRWGSAPQMLVCAALLALIGAPMFKILWGAFQSDSPLAPNATYSLDAIRRTYGQLAAGGPFAHVVLQTLALGVLVTILAIAIGAAISFLMARTDLPGAGVMRVMLLAPLFYSPLVDIIGWEFLLADRSGVINEAWRQLTGSSQPLFSIYSYAGVLLVMTLHVLPYVVLLLLGPLQSLDSASEEAAELFGATKWETVYLIAWPLMRPAVAACALFVFILAIEIFTIPHILGSRIRLETLAVWVYEWAHGFSPDLPAAAASGSLLMLIAGVALYFHRRLTSDGDTRYVTISGRGFRARKFPLGAWRWPAGVIAGSVIAVFTVIPFLAVLVRSLLRIRTTSITLESLSLANFFRLAQNSALDQFVWNSLLLSTIGAALCVAIGGVIGFWKARGRTLAVSISDYLLTAAFGLPGVLVGIGLLWTFVSTPIYMTFTILLVAAVVRFSGLAVQGAAAAAMQMDRNLEEAAESFGATRLFARIRITAPILKATLLNLWLMLFLILMRELSMTVILYGPTTATMTIQAWNYTSDGEFGLAAALSILQFAITLAVVALWRLLGRSGLEAASPAGRV